MIQTSFLSRLENAPSTKIKTKINIKLKLKLKLKNPHRIRRSVTQYDSFINIKFSCVLKKFSTHMREVSNFFLM